MVLPEQLVHLDAEYFGESSHTCDCCGGGSCFPREWKLWRRTVCPLLPDAMVKTFRSFYNVSTILNSWE